MVHLSAIHHDDDAEASKNAGGGANTSQAQQTQAQMQLPGENTAAAAMMSVYGSRFACEELPRSKIPEGPMPRDVAYRMITDDLSLDNNPRLNLASFVTTYMEEEAEKLMADSMSKNFIDYEEYPRSADIQSRCVNIIGDLFHAPRGSDTGAVGTSTVGSSEAIMLSVLAMKRRWRDRRLRQLGLEHLPDSCRPNIIMSSAVQVCWEKAARYFEIEERYVYCTPERFVIDPEEMVGLCDENTICCVLLLGTTYTGHYEDVKGVNDLLLKRGLEVGIHVDAASGGFVAPFVVPDLQWDFRLEKVISINVSGHKYGLVYPGVGWVLWRAPEHLPSDLVFNIDYLGAAQSSFTLNFSKGASQVIGQYYQLGRLGRQGYTAIMANLTATADHLADALTATGQLVVMSERNGRGLPLVAFRLKSTTAAAAEKEEERHFDEFALAHALRSRGWVVPAYTMAPNTNRLKMLRVVVREDFSRTLADMLLKDIELCLGMLQQTDRETIQRQQEYVRSHMTSAGRDHHHRSKPHKVHHAYKDEQHSLQGRTGKTHATC